MRHRPQYLINGPVGGSAPPLDGVDPEVWRLLETNPHPCHRFDAMIRNGYEDEAHAFLSLIGEWLRIRQERGRNDANKTGRVCKAARAARRRGRS